MIFSLLLWCLDDVHSSFAFLDDSGTATLKSRPGPRVRPTLNFSTSHTDAQGLAVPTPSVPAGFTDNASLGNDSKLNGNYRMYSSVGDLRLHNYYDDDEIPAPPSMPPPPPPTVAPPPPPQHYSPPSSTISSPSSPSPPDFKPPTPNSIAPLFLPTDHYAVPTAEPHEANNAAKWKSETGLNTVSKDLHMTLPNRFSLNPAAFQHSQAQTNFDVEPRSTLSKSNKIPPPAPTRISSIQLQEPQDITYPKDPPSSPVPSSFNPSFQAKLFASNQTQKSVNDTLNKRKSMLIMEDLPDFPEKSANMTDQKGSRASSLLKENTNVLQNSHIQLNKEIKNVDAITDKKIESSVIFRDNPLSQPYRLNNSTSEFTSVVSAKGEDGQRNYHNGNEGFTVNLNKHEYTQEKNKSSKPTVNVIPLKPVLGELSLSNSIDNEIKLKPENIEECPPSPPPMAPPPPPPMPVPPNRQSATPLPLPVQNMPPKALPSVNSTASPPAPPLDLAPVVRMPSPLLPLKPNTVTVTPKPPSFVPPPPPPKAPPAPPPLPNSVGPSSSIPLQEAIKAKQHTLKKIPKSIEVRPAQSNSISSVNDEQKIRVGKIKGELEALFSPKKDEKVDRLKNSQQGLEINKQSNGNFSHSVGGENKLVNSLILKVPLLPARFEKEDADVDNSEWLPKSNNLEIQIPEPDYLPTSPINKKEKSTYSETLNKIPKATLEVSVPSPPLASPEKDTDALNSSIPTYKPHRGAKILTENRTVNELPVLISKPDTDIGINVGIVSKLTEPEHLGPVVKQEPQSSEAESTVKDPITGVQVEANSPMAMLMAAQKRAQRAKSLDRKNLPKISVSSGLITSVSNSSFNERKGNTFVVVPNKETAKQFTEEQVTSFTTNSYQNSDSYSIPSTWGDTETKSSDVSSTMGRNFEISSDKTSVPYSYNVLDLQAYTTESQKDYLSPKSTIITNPISTTVPSSTESPSFNISSFPSPCPDSKMDNEIEYEIIPPPAEFMNNPAPSGSNLLSIQQKDQSYNYDHSTSLQSDFIPNYARSNSINQPFVSLSTLPNSGFNSYSSDNTSLSINRDSQRSSLIKKRLYMPEPESSRTYGSSTNPIRSTMPLSYSNMHAQTSSNVVTDPRRSNTSSRFLPQGRRVSSENVGRMVPPMTDMKYKSQNMDYSMGKSSTRSQNKSQPGMTFTVRPGTRQPISQMYQGGYL
ncbi:hypothetical protein GDO81_006396 [Engystomops pustulosus]|uniref:Uncharacterized protein n=1 Tax=Engystomops pustulosus TaxID=76066 RepID=A0AAV7CWC7_ENGPU|nr:hypothetical protein GDO81_006396 [Engystomops pustulosus]